MTSALRNLAILTPAVAVSLSGAFAGDEFGPMPLSEPGAVPAPASGLESEFHVGYSSDYQFRGAPLGGDLWEFGLDFAGTGLAGFDWSAGIWYASFDYNDIRTDASMNELDIYGEISKSFGDMFSAALGITNYSYFGSDAAADDDIEPYISLGADALGLSFGAAAYFDGANNYTHDWYFEFTAAYEHEFAPNLSGSIEAVLGIFDESNVDPSDDSDVYYGATAALSYAVSDNISVSPYAALTFSDNLGDYFWGGVSVGFSF